jgi:methylglutaconyl-CoA hydratase
MSESILEISQRGTGVAQITMSRPDVFNAFDEAMIGELDAAFDTLIADDSVRVVVLAGAGKHFSAGADLQWMRRASEASVEWNLEDARRFASMLGKIDTRRWAVASDCYVPAISQSRQTTPVSRSAKPGSASCPP